MKYSFKRNVLLCVKKLEFDKVQCQQISGIYKRNVSENCRTKINYNLIFLKLFVNQFTKMLFIVAVRNKFSNLQIIVYTKSYSRCIISLFQSSQKLKLYDLNLHIFNKKIYVVYFDQQMCAAHSLCFVHLFAHVSIFPLKMK